MGPSGSGKSTLLHLAGGLDRPTEGSVWIDGEELTRLNDDRLTELRRRLGFIFRFFNLLPVLNAIENVVRALVAEPAVILADEPTGNLDSISSDEIAGLLHQVAREWGRTVMMVTHDPRVAAYADRIIFLGDGAVVDQTALAGVAGTVPVVAGHLA